MKEVIYDRYGEGPKKYLITEKEFKEAILEWREDRAYWCRRLDAMLPKKFSFCETPKDFEGFAEILIDDNKNILYRHVPGGKIYEKVEFLSGDEPFWREVSGERTASCKNIEDSLEDSSRRRIVNIIKEPHVLPILTE